MHAHGMHACSKSGSTIESQHHSVWDSCVAHVVPRPPLVPDVARGPLVMIRGPATRSGILYWTTSAIAARFRVVGATIRVADAILLC